MMTSAMRQMIHNRVLKNVMSAGKTRQNPTIKRRLCDINEHFEEDFNAVLSSAVVFQQPDKDMNRLCCSYRGYSFKDSKILLPLGFSHFL
jgi:hypothetical protein